MIGAGGSGGDVGGGLERKGRPVTTNGPVTTVLYSAGDGMRGGGGGGAAH